ncbi:Pro-cathepsin H [Merluccius polli]|uniref:Pro-cathepsin H n=1 Tax=Merluccius polli TaxID=89951 RepID=A0AA47M348_MERPO|nr:Pro-cathepsin H [Merluccius polli]
MSRCCAAVCVFSALIHAAGLTPLDPPEACLGVGCSRKYRAAAETHEYDFKTWMSQHRKRYDGIAEYRHRLQIFTQNQRRIRLHNAGDHTFKMGLSPFTDLTFGEFKKSYLLREPQNCSATAGNHLVGSGPYPDSVDWRKRGNYVTPVKNQGNCGSCWTFSTTGCLESATAITRGKLLLLSEQQLIDCAQAFNNHGCDGGLPSQAFEYIRYNTGIMTEEDYPYKGVYDEKAMVDAVARLNPVSLGFEVTSDFMHYKEGVYTSSVCKNTTETVNHAVLAVGYGVEEEGGTPYWIVKNSWGPTWGMDGYFLIERGRNMCGLAACCSYPLV